jgi:putative transposase
MYRKKVLKGAVSERLRELVREICKANDIEIIKGYVAQDHIHLFVSVPPHMSVSKMVQYIKGKTSIKIQQEFKVIQKEFWGRHLWARGYFAASSGNVTDEIIMQYIENQDVEKEDGEFKIAE